MNPFVFLVDTFYRVLVFFYQITGHNLGLAIVIITAIVKIVLLPLVIPSIKSAKKMQELKPQMDKIKEKYGTNKQKIQQAQLELYKENKINPAAGCLPQLAQIFVLIALYNVFIKILKTPSIDNAPLNTSFLLWNLTQPDHFYILPVLAGLTQFIFSLMMQSGLESHVKNPKPKDENKKEEDSLEMAQAMQQQMLFMMPIMTTLISFNFQSGLTLYWVISTIFSIIQQYYFSGLGGLKPYLAKIGIK